MKSIHPLRNAASLGRPLSSILSAIALLTLSTTALAEVAAVSGSLGNFDVINHTGQDAYGFEMELQGVSPADVFGTFTYQS